MKNVFLRLTDLSELAKQHKLDNELYYRGGVERLLAIMGSERKRKFIRKSDKRLKDPEAWVRLKEMLEKEQSECERLALYEKTEKVFNPKEPKKPPVHKDGEKLRNDSKPSLSNAGSHNTFSSSPLCCNICVQTSNHVVTERGDKKFIQYFACKFSVGKKCYQRLKILTEKNLCTKCLRPRISKGHKGVCYKQYLCPDPSHTSQNKVHVLVCGAHCTSSENQALVEKYKNVVMEHLISNMESFSRLIKICNCNMNGHEASLSAYDNVSRSNKDGPAVFKLQTFNIGGYLFNILYDDACGDLVIKETAMEILKKLGRARQLLKGPLFLYRVSGMEAQSKAAVWEIDLPLINPTEDGEVDACMSGLCLETVTKEFPKVALKSAYDELKSKLESLGNRGYLPKVPESVGGETDILISSQYSKFHPDQVLKLNSGLTLLESKFLGFDRSTGILGRPHPSFSAHLPNPNPTYFGLGVFLSDAAAVYRSGWLLGACLCLAIKSWSQMPVRSGTNVLWPTVHHIK